VVWGRSTLLNEGALWQRGLGSVGARAGVLVWVSYFLHFRPALIAGEGWTRTRMRPRRAMRAVLAHAWAVFFAVAGLAWLVNLAFG
jgi:hypothetical protein